MGVTSARPEVTGGASFLVGPPRPSRAPAHLRQLVLRDLRWAFSPPWNWLTGLAVNLLLSLAYLLVAPLTGQPHRDWALLVGTYFAVFILADTTTTNMLGADTAHVRLHLLRGTPLVSVLLSKNLVLMIIVGVPILLATAVITIVSEANERLLITLPGVAFPVLTWLGVGNIVSVCLPVDAVPLWQRWALRRDVRAAGRWLLALVLPYGLLLLVDPALQLPRMLARTLSLPQGLVVSGLIPVITGLALWGLGLLVAVGIARLRKIHFDDLG